jgi:hypothetical protein
MKPGSYSSATKGRNLKVRLAWKALRLVLEPTRFLAPELLSAQIQLKE